MNLSNHSISGWIEEKKHFLNIRVYYEDTDFSGIVYHANYVRFLERGRTDYLRLLGVDQSDLYNDEHGLSLAVRSMTLDFQKPALMDDILLVETSLNEMKAASFIMHQRIFRQDMILLTAEITIVAIKNKRAVRIPQSIRTRIQT